MEPAKDRCNAHRYTFVVGACRFVVLNSNQDSEEQLAWLEGVLSARDSTFVAVLVHIPPFLELWDPVAWKRGESEWGMGIAALLAH